MTIANHTQPILVIIDCATDFEAELLWAINHSECTNAPLII
ncbi:MAG TPA: universal stress protein, partial [Desulfobacterales bacterium]|nr:universal stress protein [Desulfobacterales bacterium]